MASSDDEDILRDLDAAQREAVTSVAAPLLVIAGAGSGKTRVLTRRIAWRSQHGLSDTAHTLALTFTRKAAGELRARLGQLGIGDDLTAGTFHAIALAELRRRALDQRRSPPVLLESKGRILIAALDEVGITGSSREHSAELLNALAAEIEWSKARLISASEYVAAARDARRSVEGLKSSVVAELFEAYEQVKHRRGAVDFDDLILDLASEMQHDENFSAAQRWRFRHLYVDELQDANSAQLRLLDSWLGGRSDLFAVGDASQAIYGWNGADSSGVTEFEHRYPGASVLALDANYRSTPQLVEVARAVLPRAHRSSTHVAARANGAAPRLVAYETGLAEATAVGAEIQQQRLRGRRFSDCAVLARTNAQLATVERALEVAGVPVAIRGSNGFLARAGVREALRDIASSSQPAVFAQWRKQLLTPKRARRGARNDASATDPDALRIAMSRDDGDRLALHQLAEEYVALDPLPQGRGFLAYLRQSLGADPSPIAEDAVDVVTFHRAKGLEWKVVFVVGLEDGYVPSARATTREALDEERRLLYVALSRAEDELHCSWARTREFGDTTVARSPSPYVDAIESATSRLQHAQPAVSDAAAAALAKSRAVLRRTP